MKWAWERIKIGVIPLIILGIPLFIVMYIWGILSPLLESRWALHLFRVQWADVSLNILLVLISCLVIGVLLLRPKSQEFFKEHLLKFTLIGPILLHILVPKEDLTLVEVQTYDGNWEYALCLHKWTENGAIWYRVHTTGIGPGKLFSRVAEKNIRKIPAEKQKDALVTVFSFGFISGEHKDK